MMLKFIQKHKSVQIAKTILNNKHQAEGITILDFKTYYRTGGIKTACYWQKSDMQINGTE